MKRSVLLAALLSLAGCSGPQVASQKDPTVDLSHYNTFDWVPAQPQTATSNDLLDKQVRSSLQVDLAKIGVQRASSAAEPDFFVAQAIKVENIISQGSSADVGIGFGVAPGVGVGASAPVGTQTYRSQQATFTVSFYDSRSHDEVWRGTATSSLEGSNEDLNTIQGVVDKLVSDFNHDRQKTG